MLDPETWAIAEREWQHPFSAVVPVPNPAAGAAAVFTNPGAVVTELQSVTCVFVTSSSVATRVPVLVVQSPGGATIAEFPAGFTFAASKTTRITWGDQLASLGADDGARVTSPLVAYVLESGYTVSVTADAIDAADVFSSVVLSGRQWPVRAPIGN